MKLIPLTKGQFAMVDDQDYDYLNSFKWYAQKGHSTHYACRGKIDKQRKVTHFFMHRVIMNAQKGLEIDHIDHNGLNNQRSNLRICTHKENGRNAKPICGAKYRGIRFDKSGSRLYAAITVDGKSKHLGIFKTEELAAKAYDEAAKKYFGEFANLNFK